jgi:DNA-binding MarR family transcriptional regulator
MFELFLNGEAQTKLRVACGAVDLHPGHVKAMLHVAREQDLPMRALADRWSCDASYVTAIVDELEERGLASRRPHPKDRRVKTVVLTAAGRRTLDKTLERLYEPPASFGTLTPVEQRTLRDLLRKLSDADSVLHAATG